MKLDTLTKLNHKKKSFITPKHPLFFEHLEFKSTYSAGLFMQAGLGKIISPLNNFELERTILKGLGLSSKDAAGVIKKAKEGNRIIDDLITILDSPVKKYLFILDMMNVSMADDSISEEEHKSIRIFTQLLEIDRSEEKLLFEFITNSYLTDTDKCLKTYEKMMNKKMPVTMSELKFYIPEIEYVASIYGKVIMSNEVLRLVDNCKLLEPMIVPQGATLVIDNAKIEIYGNIQVDGGHLIIKDSILENNLNSYNTLIQVKNFSEVEIYNSNIDCRSFGSAINQENGNLIIENTIIRNTTNFSGIKFWGNQITIKDTIFKGCFSVNEGGALHIRNGRGMIKDCRFEDCEAKIGGAIYSTNEIMIIGCKFKFCKVTEYGSAIFYKGEVKSNISECDYYDCYPEGEELLQYIGDLSEKIITKEYTIKVPTILDIPIRVKELGIINILDCVVYMKQNIICEGLLNIKNSKIVALNNKSEYLFVLDRSRNCIIDHSKFDGNGETGLLWTRGTKTYVNKSIFLNSVKGRAIYDSYEPEIKHCIFSNCMNGALSTNAGKINNCSFINCRDKSGAGILIYGKRGEINSCQFIRCISEYSGGAIDQSGYHRITDCTFEECTPNNIN
ncbi:hypothetical protein EDD66_105123 [Mobilisporobacter senegalensis]|uniref:Right handed beta helix domain-containing protein n=1 Tax=Mobilisporobacter senegalensis TaxID=1329262 RepID=A0A3N1XNC9_9FIRM|nr:right-handed parallel beta-helix repeat-containing protein [Mobilisporobacter senegalensis]ROR28184.1 hypothetical protein EDD66_105123 [Mobilisporobacter senegalensis]